MARKKSEVARVAIGYTVLPGTKAALKRLSSKERTAGEILDLAVGYWERTLDAPETSRVDEPEPVELPVTSYWGTSYLLELQDEYGIDEKSAMDMVFDFYKSMGKACPACAGRLGGFGEAEEAVATSSVAPSTLTPGDVRCLCAHCGEVYMASRVGNLCFGCASRGHAGDVRDCSVCGEARGL